MKKTKTPRELLEELRNGSRWVSYATRGVDSSAALLKPTEFLEGCAFLLLNKTAEVPFSPFHFNAALRPSQFRTYDSVEACKDDCLSEILESRPRLLVVAGVFNEPREFLNDRCSFWRVLSGLSGHDEERRLVDARTLLLEIEELATHLRSLLRSAGAEAIVVQALHDGSQRETYWDLERIVKRDVLVNER